MNNNLNNKAITNQFLFIAIESNSNNFATAYILFSEMGSKFVYNNNLIKQFATFCEFTIKDIKLLENNNFFNNILLNYNTICQNGNQQDDIQHYIYNSSITSLNSITGFNEKSEFNNKFLYNENQNYPNNEETFYKEDKLYIESNNSIYKDLHDVKINIPQENELKCLFISKKNKYRKYLHQELEDCEKSSQTNIMLHDNLKKNYSYKCNNCSKIYKLNRHLKDHMARNHHELINYSCLSCEKVFISQKLLNIHVKTEHNYNLYHCSICDISFKYKTSILYHQKTKHSNNDDYKPHQCSICGKSFKIKKLLNLHIKSHSDLRPFTCSICGKKFKRRFALKEHQLSHTQEKAYICQLCDKRFKDRSGLAYHNNTQHSNLKPYQCCICSSAFSTPSLLHRHELRHKKVTRRRGDPSLPGGSNGPPYICQICDKSCRDIKIFRDHMRSHTGERPYVCEVCYKGFAVKAYLLKHQKNWYCKRRTVAGGEVKNNDSRSNADDRILGFVEENNQ